jgi:hypothetical protein
VEVLASQEGLCCKELVVGGCSTLLCIVKYLYENYFKIKDRTEKLKIKLIEIYEYFP